MRTEWLVNVSSGKVDLSGAGLKDYAGQPLRLGSQGTSGGRVRVLPSVFDHELVQRYIARGMLLRGLPGARPAAAPSKAAAPEKATPAPVKAPAPAPVKKEEPAPEPELPSAEEDAAPANLESKPEPAPEPVSVGDDNSAEERPRRRRRRKKSDS